MFEKVLHWFDQRLPVSATFERHLSKYPAPIGQNFWYLAGVLLIVVLVIQFISGIWLLMSYEPTADRAFASIQYIMREVEVRLAYKIYAHYRVFGLFLINLYAHV